MIRPLIFTETDLATIKNLSQPKTIQPSKTYKIDFNSGEIYSEFIDLEDAVEQMVTKMLKTRRKRYLIYSTDYGSELSYLLGKSYSIEYLNLEIPRLVNEALMIDDRIKLTSNYVISRTDDQLNISFEVTTTFGKTVVVEVLL